MRILILVPKPNELSHVAEIFVSQARIEKLETITRKPKNEPSDVSRNSAIGII